MAKGPWDDIDEIAEAMLIAEAGRLGCDLRDLGILSRRRLAHIRKYEVPMSRLPVVDDEDENA